MFVVFLALFCEKKQKLSIEIKSIFFKTTAMNIDFGDPFSNKGHDIS